MIQNSFKIAVLALVSTLFFACNSGQEKKSEALSDDDIALLMAEGDRITNHAQKTLLENVSAAMQEGGSDYAVEFCNTAAIPLTDSIANIHNADIQRLTDKNRNPNNILSSEMDKTVWETFQVAFQSEEPIPTTFLEEKNGEYYYYKPIAIGMNTCLQCHGKKDDISESTRAIIAQKYPDDKALDYEMGELRGMWKVKLENE